MARSRRNPGHDLSRSELEVLNVLWERGRGTVREVLAALHARGRRVAYTTALTFLARLEQKGYVATDKSGQAYVYRPAVARERIRTSRLRTLIQQFYGGAACPLVLQLMERERFTAEEIAQLQQLVERLDSRQQSGSASS
jgi:predicted transcriptional regulator